MQMLRFVIGVRESFASESFMTLGRAEIISGSM